MANYDDKWLAVAGGGFGFSAIGGIGVYQVELWNVGGQPIPIRALIIGKRLGLMLQAEAGHAICFMCGVRSPGEFDNMYNSGIDWALAIGLDVAKIIKSSGKVLTVAAKAAGAGMINWAAENTGKKVVEYLMGDLDLDTSKPAFPLKDLKPAGKMVTGMLSVTHNNDIDRNTSIKIGPSMTRSHPQLCLWDADDYVKIATGPTGQFSGVRGNPRWKK